MSATLPMLWHVTEFVFPAAFSLLPTGMDTPAARAMLLAIGLQESKFKHRVQVLSNGRRGPALGFWQFERGGGTKGVLSHPRTWTLAERVCRQLCYEPRIDEIWPALEHNDVLACALARLNLWWLPDALPAMGAHEDGWGQYLAAWRPGKPHPETWEFHYLTAWGFVERNDLKRV